MYSMKCAAWASTLITHKHSPNEEKNQGKQKQQGNLFMHEVYNPVRTHED